MSEQMLQLREMEAQSMASGPEVEDLIVSFELVLDF